MKLSDGFNWKGQNLFNRNESKKLAASLPAINWKYLWLKITLTDWNEGQATNFPESSISKSGIQFEKQAFSLLVFKRVGVIVYKRVKIKESHWQV